MSKRTPSEETEIRALLKKLTDHVLEMKEGDRKFQANVAKDLKVIKAQVDAILEELPTLATKGQLVELGRKLDSVATVAGGTERKTNDLHSKLIGSADSLGRRIHDLEKERGKRGGHASRAPSRR